MSITNGYVTEVAFRAAIGDDSTLQLSTVEACIQTASRQVDAICDRRFYADTNASARVFSPCDLYTCRVDDFYTTTGLVVAVDTDDSGTFDQTWTISTHFVVYPENGLQGPLAWPYFELHAVGDYTFPPALRRKPVQVTAKWGWTSVPDAVATATLLLAVANYKAPEAPGGLLIDGATGVVVRQRTDARVMALLAPYMRAPVAVG